MLFTWVFNSPSTFLWKEPTALQCQLYHELEDHFCESISALYSVPLVYLSLIASIPHYSLAITRVLLYILIYGRVSCSNFAFKIFLDILDFCISESASNFRQKIKLGSWVGFIEFIGWFGENSLLYNIKSSDLWSWHIPPFLSQKYVMGEDGRIG